MRSHLTLFLGVFSIMALSNAIVPVLPGFASRSSWTGAIYAAYFLGAFISTLPAGILSDKYGRLFLMRIGLLVTIVSGIWLYLPGDPAGAAAARFLEGIGAGLFVAPAMAWVNKENEHAKASGYFIALLNAGLVLGLLAAGFFAIAWDMPRAGLLIFSGLAVLPALSSLISRDPGTCTSGQRFPAFLPRIREYRGIWYSTVVLVGITGVVTSLYPKYSGAPADLIGLWVAGMSIATIGAVLAVSHTRFREERTLQISAVLMTAGVLITVISPWGFLVIGFIAGLVMMAQMAILARDSEHQGILMGLFSTMSYLGMALLPFLAGLLADAGGFVIAFGAAALAALTAIPLIRRH